jgi:trigger factor
MDYKLNHLSNVEKELEITFSAEEVKKNIQGTLSHLSRTASIKGFRKGKVPLNVVKQMYGKSIKDEAENHFVSTGIQETAVKENLKFATAPDIFEKSAVAEGDPFIFKYRVEVFPSVDVEVKPLEAEYMPLKFKDEMVDQELEEIRKRFVEFKETTEDQSAEKDRMTITFSGKIGEEDVEGTKGNNVTVVLGEKRFVPDFEKALYGHKSGDNFSADVKFPQDYQAKELAGKTVTFSITVDKVEKCENEPELTDEFLAGKEGYPNTVEALREEMKKHILEHIDNLNLDNRKYVAIDTYVKNHEIDIPPSILKSEVEARVDEHKKKNKVEEIAEDVRQKIEDDAKWVAKRYIILHELSEKLNITVTERDVNEALAKEAAHYGLPAEYAEQLRKYYGEERLNAKKMEIREGKVLEKITEAMIFNEKTKEEKKDEGQNS